MKKMKLAAVAAATLMAATTIGTLAGCTDKEHTISVFLLTNATETKVYKQYFKDLEKEIEEDTGVRYKIDYVGKEKDDYYTKLLTDVGRGNVPDVFYLRPNEMLWYQDVITDLQDFANTQDFANLNGIYQKALDMYRFNPETREIGNPQDHLYAFPKDLSTQQLGYNRTLVEKYQSVFETLKLPLPWDMGDTPYTWTEYKAIVEGIANKIAADGEKKQFASDVPSIEVLAHSYAVHAGKSDFSLINLPDGKREEGVVTSITEGPVADAIKYQAELVDAGANYKAGTYENFTSGWVCFYGLTASWEVKEYNTMIGDGKWGVMPWPVVAKGEKWNGLITSAGYVVSKQCASMEKGDIAKRIAISFLSDATQEKFVKDEKITLPLRSSVQEDYKNPENDGIYSPDSRGIFLDVISGDHGFLPATYSTYNSAWLEELSKALEVMWLKGKGYALSYYNSALSDGTWAKVQRDMQAKYDDNKQY